ncbi:MAG: spermidine/putrescine ABC transporter permease [Phototrophicales bacterium]|nr:MAG: spermidine/putrescine ABC transporter permease [Phototrophicales bacterium]
MTTTQAPPVAFWRKWRGAALAYLLVAPPLLLMVLLIFIPALQSIARTLTISVDGEPGFSISRYTAFFSDPISVNNLIFTFQVTLLTLAAIFVVCFPLALYLRFSSGRVASIVQILALFPLFVPGIILCYALIRFLGTRGTLDTVLNLVGITGYRTPYLKPEAIIIGLVWESIPFTVLVLTAGLRQVSDSLIESARDVGADDWTIFRRIILPLITRPALIAFSLNFLGIFGSYTIPYLLGPAAPQMMGVFMQQTFGQYRRPDDAETQAVITFIICAFVGFLYVRTVARQRITQEKDE